MEISENALVVGTVARLEPVKGVGMLIEAVGEIISGSNKRVRFLIVGDGEELRKLKARSRRLGIDEALIFTGYQSRR